MEKHIDEVLYSISPDTVVARRYNPILGIIITVVAAGTMQCNWISISQPLQQPPNNLG